MTMPTAVSEASVMSWVGAFQMGNASMVMSASCCFTAMKDVLVTLLHYVFVAVLVRQK